MQKTLYFEFNIERERRVTQILHSVQGAHLQQNWQDWTLHTGNSQHLPSWQGQWWVFGSPWTASFSLWAAVLFHWTTTGWTSLLWSRSWPQHPYSLWLWCCWLGGWVLSHALWRNRESTHWEWTWDTYPCCFLRDLSHSQSSLTHVKLTRVRFWHLQKHNCMYSGDNVEGESCISPLTPYKLRVIP